MSTLAEDLAALELRAVVAQQRGEGLGLSSRELACLRLEARRRGEGAEEFLETFLRDAEGAQ